MRISDWSSDVCSSDLYADLQAYDDVIQAASGTTSLLPRVDGDPRPRYFPSLIADKVAGQFGAQAILAALVHKFRTGEGQEVQVPMFECFTSFMLVEHLRDAAQIGRASCRERVCQYV